MTDDPRLFQLMLAVERARAACRKLTLPNPPARKEPVATNPSVLNITIEPIDIDAVVLPRKRYEELLGAEQREAERRKASGPTVAPPAGDKVRIRPSRSPFDEPYGAPAPFSEPIFTPVPPPAFDWRRRANGLEQQLARQRRLNDTQFEEIRDLKAKLADSSERHRKATIHVRDRVHALAANQQRIAELTRTIDSTARIEISPGGTGQPTVKLTHGSETAHGHLTDVEIDHRALFQDIIGYSGFAQRDAVRPRSLRDASNVTFRA